MTRLGSIPVSQDISVGGGGGANSGDVLSPSPTLYECIPRTVAATTVPGRMQGMCFTATRTGTINEVRALVGATAISGFTLLRTALYAMDPATDNATLLAGSNPITGTQAINTEIIGTLPGGVPVTAGLRYCFALLQVGGTGGTLIGNNGTGIPAALSNLIRVRPRMGFVTSTTNYTDLPPTVDATTGMGGGLSMLLFWGVGT
jgi:hypothetical protein